MNSISKRRYLTSKIKTLGITLILIVTVLLATVAFAQVGGLTIFTKAGEPTELVADGKSQTSLLLDLSGCAWYPGAGSADLLQVYFQSNLGTSLSPPSINSTIGDVGSPFEIILIAGSQSGTATVTATASYCTEGNTMVMGTCSSKDEQDNPKCTGEFEIYIAEAGASEEEESQEESEETEELSVSIACPPNPIVGKSVTCTASVSGAGKDESLEYQWSLDGLSGPKAKSNTFTWNGTDPGYYEVAVDVFGTDRTANKTLRVNVLEGETDQKESSEEDTLGSESAEISELTGSLEAFLEAAGVSHISPSRLAVAGGGIVTLIAIWMIVNHRSGVPLEKLEGVVRQWRGKEGAKPPKAPPEVQEKPSQKPGDKPPQALPEMKKIDKGAEPPSSVPEEKGVELKDKPNLCLKCGHPNTPGAKFCNECGASI